MSAINSEKSQNDQNTMAMETTTMNCKDFLLQMGPIDTLLGSLSYNDVIDSAEGKTQQIRTSARVFKKMKFDLSNAQALDKKG